LTIRNSNLCLPSSLLVARLSSLAARSFNRVASGKWRATSGERRHASAPCTLRAFYRRACARQQIICGRKKLPFAEYSVVKEPEISDLRIQILKFESDSEI